MLKVRIKDFQSIGDLAFEVKGFTLIIGKNNIGKSAIIRAIDAALSNKTGSEFIRLGKTKTSVSLEKDGLQVQWTRGDSVSYKINGDNFTKLNRQTPKPLLDAGFRKIEAGDLKLNPLVAHQFDELFLIDKPSVVTDILSVIYDLDTLSDADTLCQKELRANKTLLKTREGDLAKVQTDLQVYQDLDGLKKDISVLKTLEAKIEGLKKEIVCIAGYESKLHQATSWMSALDPIESVKDIPVPDLDKQVEALRWIRTVDDELRIQASRFKSLGKISEVVLPETDPSEKHISELETLTSLTSSLRTTATEIKRSGRVLQILSETSDLSTLLDQIVLCQNRNDSIQKDIQDLSYLEGETAAGESGKEQILKELSTAEAELGVFKTCPVCEKPL